MNIVLTPWQRLLEIDGGKLLRPVRDIDAAHFYWCTEIKATEISAAYCNGIHTNKLIDVVGPAVFSDRKCLRCKNEIYAFSRSSAAERLKAAQTFVDKWRGCDWADPRICHVCEAQLYAVRHVVYADEMKRRQSRVDELKYMPYRDYLKTPEWKATRESAIRRARGCCQTCSSKDRLNVHHRTYARRGSEYNSDLIVLCEPCHKLFHDHGRLADGGRAAA